MSQLPLHPSLTSYGSKASDIDRICSACWTSNAMVLVGDRKGNLMFIEVGPGLKLTKTVCDAHAQEICAIFKQNGSSPYSAMYGSMASTLNLIFNFLSSFLDCNWWKWQLRTVSPAIENINHNSYHRCWDERFLKGNNPLLHLHHGAAVKAVKFATSTPLPSHFLITGSGSRDQKIRICKANLYTIVSFIWCLDNRGCPIWDSKCIFSNM